jgi:hypothetical protein
MEQNNIDIITEKLKQTNDAEKMELAIKEWYEKIHTQSLKLGAKYISAAIMGAIQKHLHKEAKVTLRDYKRCMDDIIKIISVQLRKEEIAESAKEEEVVEEKEITNE